MKNTIVLFFILILTSCSTNRKIDTEAKGKNSSNIVVSGKMFTALYMQRAAEYHALCYQAFNFARVKVDAWKRSATPTAIVTDIDETILDNSAYAAHRALLGKDFEQNTWNDWTAMAEADTIPGALAFLQYASSKGIEIFYITNRGVIERRGTLQNLIHFKFPNADSAHLLTKAISSSKEERKVAVLKTHNILLLMGDNLSDFSMLYDKKNINERLNTAKQMADKFGNDFIVLPNPNYGDWESALYNYNYGLTPNQKDSVIKAWLKTY